MLTENIIEVTDLRVRYGALTAVDGLCIAVKRGEAFGLLGPNGAGKSKYEPNSCANRRRPDDHARGTQDDS